jgi:hypothetical protein
MTTKRYVWRDDHFRDPETNAPMPLPKRRGVTKPLYIIKDMEPYRSVVEGGRVIGGRTARREELARLADRGLVPWEPISSRPRGLINKEFCGKRGLKTDEATQEWASAKLATQAAKAAAIREPK